MKVAALYDVHGNLPGLEAVLRDLEREHVDAIVCGGDVTWGPFQHECIERLRSAGARFLAGNCERDVLYGDSERVVWCRAQLGDGDRALIGTWPATIELELPLGRVLFCHATPSSDDAIVTRSTPDDAAAAAVGDVAALIVVCGHTHVQYDRRLPGGLRLVNAGSVGLAYETVPGAHWALLGEDVELRRTDYDLEAAAVRLLEPGFPHADDVFGAALRGDISPEEATERFEGLRGA